MVIGFFGDSYCADKYREGYISWPDVTGAILNAEVRLFSKAGTHAYGAYLKLKEFIDEVDIVVFVISDPYRFPNEHGVPMMSSGYDLKLIEQYYSSQITANVGTMLKTYYGVFSREFMQMGQRELLRQVDLLLEQKNKRAYVLPAFELSLCDYEFKNAVWTDDILKVEFGYIDRVLNYGFDYKHLLKNGYFANHFSPHGNLILGQFMAYIIETYNSPQKFNMKKEIDKASSKPSKTQEELEKEYQKKLEELRKRDPFVYKNF